MSLKPYTKAVKVTHTPTGVTATVTDQQYKMRTEKKRRDRAVEILKLRLRQREYLIKLKNVNREMTGDLLETLGL